MPVTYSTHATKRMRERFITEREAGAVMDRPIEVIETRYARRTALGRPSTGDKFIVVVFEVSGEDFMVVPASK